MSLGPEDAVTHLRERGLLGADEPASAERLDGGVSSDVIRVVCGARSLVVKRPLPTLRVARYWSAPVERVHQEALGLRLASELTPGAVPQVLDVDLDHHVLVMTHAPEELSNWKGTLLTEVRPDVATAVALGSVLAQWHLQTSRASLPSELTDPGRSLFRTLRIAPFYEAVAAAHPGSGPIGRAIADLEAPGVSLVHGDFSPKNVLAHGADVCVLDWEVAHFGAPVFDVAFMACHLLLKGLRAPREETAHALAGLWQAFDGAYTAKWPLAPFSDADLGLHAACLVLARIDGVSPVEYLSADERSLARRLALTALSGRLTVGQIWEALL